MSRKLLIPWVLLVPSMALPCAADLGAQETPTPVEAVRLLLLAFRFDRALEARGGLKVAVLYTEDAAEAEAIRRFFEETGSSGVQGMPVVAVAVRFESVAVLLEVFERERVTTVYIPESLGAALSSIQQVTRARKLPSLSAGRRLVESGVSMGVILSDGGAKLIVNLRSAQVEGLDLSAEVLALAEIIR